MDIQSIIQRVIGANRILDYIISFSLFLVCVLIVKIFKHFVLKRLKRFTDKTATVIDDFIVNLLRRILVPFMYLARST